MLPSIRSHAQYQSFVLEQLRTHYSGGILMLVAKDWTFIEKFWLVDLSGTASVLSRQYATRGIHATDPADILRSYLLMLQVGCISVTKWVDELRRVPLYAIISGFIPGHTPGVGTFYDFFTRLWPSTNRHLTGLLKPKRNKKPVKGKKGEKAPTTTPKKWSDWLIGFSFVTPRSHLCHSISSCPCFATSLYRSPRHLVSSVTCQLSLSRETELLCEPLPSLVASAYVIVKKEASINAPVTVFIHNPIATLGGTAIATAIILATTSICSQRRTVDMTFHSTPDWAGLPAMTLSHSSH